MTVTDDGAEVLVTAAHGRYAASITGSGEVLKAGRQTGAWIESNEGRLGACDHGPLGSSTNLVRQCGHLVVRLEYRGAKLT